MEREAAVREAEQRAEGGSHMKDLPDLEDHAPAPALQKQAKQDAATEAEQRRERGRQEQIKELRDRAEDAGAAASKKAEQRRKPIHAGGKRGWGERGGGHADGGPIVRL